MHAIIMGFGAVLSIVGILLFTKGVKESQSSFKSFGISFNISNPGIVIFIVGCVIFMTPYVLQTMKKEPAKLKSDEKATGVEIELAEKERRKAEEERISTEEQIKEMEEIKAAIESEKERLSKEVKGVGEERLVKKEELAWPKRESEKKVEIAKRDKKLVRLTAQMAILQQITSKKLKPLLEKETHRINIGSEFGDRDIFEFKVTKPGPIKIQVSWQGAPELALMLNGPGEVGYYARKDGTSPLSFTYDVVQPVLDRGTGWRVSVVNFSKSGYAEGRVIIEHPE